MNKMKDQRFKYEVKKIQEDIEDNIKSKKIYEERLEDRINNLDRLK